MSTKVPAKPAWLKDEAWLKRLLNEFLNKLEKNQTRLQLRISDKTVPELYEFQHRDLDYRWALLQALDKDYHLWTVQLARPQPHQPLYHNATLRLMPAAEPILREWLARPAFDAYSHIWQKVLAKLAEAFEDGGQALLQNPVRTPQGAEATLRGFACIGRELTRPVTLRALSARCFWGDSKFLDHREQLVRSLYPEASAHLQVRPLLLVVRLDRSLRQVLFVENQDTFLMLCKAPLDGTTLVYSAGFRGPAARVRSAGQVVFSFVDAASDLDSKEWEQWWFKENCSFDLACYFWGDLDFAGMAILKSLRQSFPSLVSWQPGYLILLERLQQGAAHTPVDAGKERQLDPGQTGCPYADEILLPAMRSCALFVDQEAARMHEIVVPE